MKLKMIIRKKVGKRTYIFEVEADSFYEVITEQKKLSFDDIEKCGLCGSDDLELSAHKAQNKFEYTYIRCKHCRASLNFGKQLEDPDIVYLKTIDGNDGKKYYDWKKYSPEGINE